MQDTYLFISDNMYTGRHSQADKNPDPINGVEVSDVKEQGGNAFCKKQFSYVYNGQTYITAYAWALVKNTPENVQLLKERNELRREIEEIKRKAESLTAKMQFVE